MPESIFASGLGPGPANFSPLTPLRFLSRSAAVHPDRTAIVHGSRRISYREFDARSRRLASALAARGIGEGDTVAVVLPNVPAMLEAHQGVPALGAVLNAINTRLAARTIALNYTSGTTGNPKGVVFHHRGTWVMTVGQILSWHIPPGAVYLWTLPMFHANGWCFPWSVNAMAGTHVCLRRVDPALIFRLIAEHRVTNLVGAPTVLSMLINAPAETRRRFDHVVDLQTGGAAPPAKVIRAMSDLGFRVQHIYGLTEVLGPSTLCAWQDAWSALSPEAQAARQARQGVPYHVVDGQMVADPKT